MIRIIYVLTIILGISPALIYSAEVTHLNAFGIEVGSKLDISLIPGNKSATLSSGEAEFVPAKPFHLFDEYEITFSTGK